MPACTKSFAARSVLACAAAASVLTLAAPSFAQEPPPGSYDYRYGDDACRREKDNKAVAGAVVGGILGAVVGSQISGHGARTEGSVIGGGVGALGGMAVGSDSVRCQPSYPRTSYDDGRYDGSGYDRGGYDRDDYDRGTYGPGYYDADRRGADVAAYEDDADAYAYDGEGRAYPVVDGPPSADGCALAESSIYMPDGQVQKRFVRVCRDRSGRYQVVE